MLNRLDTFKIKSTENFMKYIVMMSLFTISNIDYFIELKGAFQNDFDFR
jgi:hypothetical protein